MSLAFECRRRSAGVHLATVFRFCSYVPMNMIRASDEEIARVIRIAVTTAPNHAIRNVFKEEALDRTIAVATLTERVFRALDQFEVRRPAKTSDVADSFPVIPGLLPPT